MKKVILSMMAVAALASCSKDNETPAPTTDPNEITLVSNMVGVETKAPLSGELKAVARVLATSTSTTNFAALYGTRDGDNTYIKFNGTTTLEGFTDATGANEKPEFYQGDNEVFLCGFYPAAWTVNGEFSAIDGKTDVLFAPAIRVTKNTEDANRKLTFHHLLTKLNVKVKLENGSVDNWGTIKSMTLTSNTKVNLDVASLPTDVTTIPVSSFSESKALSFYTINEDAAISSTALPKGAETAATDFAYVMCAPVTATGTDDYILTIVTEKGGTHTVGVDLKDEDDSSAFTGSTLGYQFDIVLNFQSTEILATATVAPWNTGGQVEIDINASTAAN